MHKTTILQVIPTLDTGGAELSTLEIADAVVRAGGRALVVSEGGRLEDQLRDIGGEIVLHPVASKNPLRIFKNAKWLAELIEKENVTLVHARSRAPAWSALMAARRAQRPFVTTYHGAYSNTGYLKNKYNSVMARGDIVIANSQYTANLIQKEHNPPIENVRVIHRGVDPDLYSYNEIGSVRLNALRQKWGVRPDQRIILKAARLTRWKGQDVLIDAIGMLKYTDALKNCIFILAGDAQGRDEYKKYLLDKISKLGLSSYIRLVGHCEDMPAAFAIAHTSVVASYEPEAFGRAAVEAQVSQCPVIVTNIGATDETVLASPDVTDEQITGWRIPPKNPEILAENLTKALSLDEENRSIIGQRARAHVINNFTLEQMRHKTLNVYDELIGSKLSHI